MSPHELAVEAENAYDSRDRDTFLRALAKLVVLADRRTPDRVAAIASRDPPSLDSSPSD